MGVLPEKHCSGAEPPYAISLNDNKILVNSKGVSNSPNEQWLQYCLLPKFTKWWTSFADDTESSERIESLSLINIEEYNQLYNELKDKYGIDMVKVSLKI